MKKLFLAFALVACFAVSALSQGAPPWTIQEVDGSPRVNSPTLIKVTNGTLSCTGKTCTITISGGGGGSPGGSSTQVQYNAAGSFGGISGFTSDGTNVTAGSGNLRATSPRITTGINDSNGNELILFTATVSAVNEFTIANAATGGNPTFSATGDDADINIRISPKGAGGVVLSNGTAANAGLRFASDATSVGWYRTAQSWTYTYVGTTQFALPAEGIRLSNGIALTFSTGSAESSGSDTRLVRTGTNTIRLANATTGAGNLIIGTSAGAIGTSGAGVLAFTLSTEPSTGPTDTTQLYYKDFAAGDGRLYLRNEASAAGSPVANLGDAQTFTGRITFSPGATTAGINVGSVAGNPSAPSNADLWYNTATNELYARINGANVALGSGGGGGITVGTTTITSGTNTRLPYNNAGVYGEISGFTSDGTNVTAGSGNLRATSPRITTEIDDANGAPMLIFSPTTSATQAITIANNTATNAVSLTASAPAAATTTTAGTPFNLSASAATAGTTTAGAAAGGSLTFTAGDAARLTSGNANGGNINLIAGAGIGTGTAGQVFVSRAGSAAAPAFAVGATGDGLFSIGSGVLAITTGGVQRAILNSNGLAVSQIGISDTSQDNWLRRSGVNILQLAGNSGGTTPATFSTPARTPAQITADQNNYAPGTGWFQRWSSDASRNITGMSQGNIDGQLMEIWNVGSNNIVLQNENASSTAANRFTTSTGADLTLTAGKCAIARYDTTSTRWRVYLCN